MAKRITNIVCVGILLGLLVLHYQPDVFNWVPVVGPAGPVDHVVVICESGDQTPEHAVVLLGKTARELRDVDKWRLWDVNEIPESIQVTIKKLIEGQQLPVVILFQGGKVWVGPLPLPKSDLLLRKLVDENGGF